MQYPSRVAYFGYNRINCSTYVPELFTDIVDRDRRIMERFEFDQTTMSNVEICNRLWNMGDTVQRH